MDRDSQCSYSTIDRRACLHTVYSSQHGEPELDIMRHTVLGRASSEQTASGVIIQYSSPQELIVLTKRVLHKPNEVDLSKVSITPNLNVFRVSVPYAYASRGSDCEIAFGVPRPASLDRESTRQDERGNRAARLTDERRERSVLVARELRPEVRHPPVVGGAR